MRVLFLVLALSAMLGAQAQPRFEAASIKPSGPNAPPVGRMMTIGAVTTPGRLTMRNASLKDLIKAAWSLEDYQVTAGPAWMASARFDVEGKSADGAGRERLLVMLRS